MYAILFIATMLGMGLIARIKNDILRAAIGIPMVVAMFCLGMLTFASAISAQWKPDRADYEVLSDGNFYTTAHDMQTALSIALNTLEYNGAKMHTLNVNRKDVDAPLYNYFHRSEEEGRFYMVYVARTKTGYVIWFRYLPEGPVEFEEEYTIIQYEGLE
jgi:hypothetical protein